MKIPIQIRIPTIHAFSFSFDSSFLCCSVLILYQPYVVKVPYQRDIGIIAMVVSRHNNSPINLHIGGLIFFNYSNFRIILVVSNNETTMNDIVLIIKSIMEEIIMTEISCQELKKPIPQCVMECLQKHGSLGF